MTDIDLKSAEEAADRYDGLGVPMSAYQPQIAEMRNRAGLPTKPVSAARSTAPEAGKAVDDARQLPAVEVMSADTLPSGDEYLISKAFVHEGAIIALYGTNDKLIGWIDTHAWTKGRAYRGHLLPALASVVPSGAEPAAWMVLRKGNLHLPVLTSKEDAVRYQQYNPEETLQPLYTSPQAVLADERWKAIFIERLKAL